MGWWTCAQQHGAMGCIPQHDMVDICMAEWCSEAHTIAWHGVHACSSMVQWGAYHSVAWWTCAWQQGAAGCAPQHGMVDTCVAEWCSEAHTIAWHGGHACSSMVQWGAYHSMAWWTCACRQGAAGRTPQHGMVDMHVAAWRSEAHTRSWHGENAHSRMVHTTWHGAMGCIPQNVMVTCMC